MSESDHERRGPIAWMARHSIAANLLMGILLVGGFWSALRIQKEVFPEFQLDIVEIRVEYPGAAPTEVEQGVILPVEETIRGVEGIKEIQSRAREGTGTVTIELVAGSDRMRAFQDIDQAVSRITTFPDDIEQPEVRLQASDREVMELVLYGETDIRSLRRLAERLRDQLLNEETITQVALDNAPDYVTHVEIPRDRLREHGRTLDRVAAIIRDSSEDVAAGAVRTGSGEILLRMKERKQFAEEFGDIEILASESGSSVTLADLAEIRDGFEEEGFHSRFNQSPSVEIKVFRVGDQSPLDISRSVQEVMEDLESTLPSGVEWRIDSNSAKDYDERMSLLEALFILPAHLGHARRNPRRTRLGQGIRNAQQAFARGFDGFVDRHYRRFLHLSLRFRYVTITAALALFAVVGGYATSSHMGMILMPAVSADEIEAGIDLPVGVTPDQAAQVALDVTASTREMFDEHDLGRVAEGIKTNVRRGSFIDVEIVMKPPDQRDMTAAEVIELWRDQIGDIPGVDQITFSAEAGPSGYRPDITVSLSHADIAVLEAASRDLLAEMEKFETIRDDYNKGKTQFDFRLRPEGRALGLTSEDVGRQLRDSFYGALALRQLRGTNEVEVRVKLPEAEREDLHHLEDLVIFTPGGTEVPLFDVVEIGRGEAFTSINRRDGRRVVNVSADVEPKRAITRVITALRGEVQTS